MGLRQIRKDGDDILRKVSKPVSEISASTISLIDDMLETLRASNGIGIAAPQVGVLRRIAIVEHEEDLFELINPEVVEEGGSQVCNEACLSIPGYSGDIDRPMTVTVRALNRQGETVTITVDDFLASAFCHELDHLNGILFTDNATNVQMITNEQLQQRKKKRRRNK